MNPDLECPTDRCHNATFKDPTWLGGNIPGLNEINPPLKDTVIVPAGGYVVIRFLADNPGEDTENLLSICYRNLRKHVIV